VRWRTESRRASAEDMLMFPLHETKEFYDEELE
jgi:hypothetical protein